MNCRPPASVNPRLNLTASYFAAVGINVEEETGSLRPSSLPPEPVLSNDAVLNALAQTGPLRLKCDRAFVSLIGQQWQYIIAESALSLPYRRSKAKPDDRLCLGFSAIAGEMAICLNTLKCFTDTTGKSAINDSNTQADCTKYIIRDLRRDSMFCARPYVTGWPSIRAYLEVPLRTSTGHVIGSYCVVDSQLRDDFDDSAVSLMADIAQNIMDHLNLLKMKQQYERAERLVRGLGVFVDGCSSLKDLPQDDNAHAPPYTIPLHDNLSNGDISQASSYSLSIGLNTASEKIPSSVETDNPSHAEIATPLSSVTDVDPLDIERDLTRFNESSQTLPDKAPCPPQPKSSPPPAPRDASLTFSRAANLIRKGTSIEGIVFLDACPTGFGALSNTSTLKQRHTSDHLSGEAAVPLPKYHGRENTCEILGSSTGSRTAPINENFNVPEELLQRLIRSNPRGCLIYADNYGPISSYTRRADDHFCCDFDACCSTSDPSNEDIEQLLRIVPQARSILFLPLWDYQNNTWYAATIGWTTDPTLAFEESDMTYVSAFSNSIMIEIARLDALVVGAAKGDFLSCISHEFRSPLHGIMASAELLEETMHDSDQRQLTGMIKSCATTLIDTTNHLLDYSKINHLVKDGRPQLKRASLSLDQSHPNQGEGSITTLSSTVDLAKLVEDVVEGAFVGNAWQAESSSREVSVHPPVVVTMDIEKRDKWTLRTEPGVWRRIVMNLFGNALKYTAQGSIKVSLKTVETTLSPDLRRTDICFSVEDTGCGMSAEFVKRQLFLPYSQENPLSSGVGLGLNIVQHLIKELDGRIEVDSTPDVGTLMQVIIPRNASMELLETPPTTSEDQEQVSIRALHRKTVLALDFDASESSHSPDPKLIPSFTAIAKAGLGIDVLASTETQALQRGDAEDMPLIVLCRSPPTVLQKQQALFQNAIVLVQPFGPRKVAWTVARAFASHKPRDNVPTAPESAAHTQEQAKASGGSADVDTAHSLPAAAPPSDKLLQSARVDSLIAANAETPDASRLPPPPSSTTTMTTTTATRKKLHVLIVDDNSVNLKILTAYMSKLHCTYETAINGLEAVQAFGEAAQPFDYIFMDISMPIMNGFEATRKIRAEERGRPEGTVRTVIVALTGLGSSSSQKEAFTSGIDLYLIKPVPLKKLRELVLGKEGV